MDQVDPLRQCKDARDRMEQAAAVLRGYGDIFGAISEGLSAEPICLRLANSDLAVSINVPHSHIIDYQRIPSAEQLKANLADYYAAQADYDQSYRRLPSDEQTLFDRASIGGGAGRGAQRMPYRVL